MKRLIHFHFRDTNFFLLEDLESDAEYEVDLYLIPMPNSKTELVTRQKLKFHTKQPVHGRSSPARHLKRFDYLP